MSLIAMWVIAMWVWCVGGCAWPRVAGTAQSNKQVILGDEQLTLFLILGPVDLAAAKAPIENVDRCGASVADARPIRHPDNDGG